MSSSRLPPPASFSAAAVATVIGFGGTVALIVQAGQTLGASPAQIISMVTALCLGIGLPGENAHAPNEWLDLGNFHNGVLAAAYLYDELSRVK